MNTQERYHRYASKEAYEAWFWSRVTKIPGGCWLWDNLGTGNYPDAITVFERRKRDRPHRIAYTLVKGAVPDGLLVCHSCDNTACVNAADHLFLGTEKDNMDDMWAKGRGPRGPRGPNYKKPPRTHCKRGHILDEANSVVTVNSARPHLTIRRCRTCRKAAAQAGHKRRRREREARAA